MTRIAHALMPLAPQGSTLHTVAGHLSAAEAAAGDAPAVVVSHNRDVCVPGAQNLYVDYTTRCPRERFTRAETAADVVAGTAGFLRPFHGRLYLPAVQAAEGWRPDVVLLYEGHYAASSLPLWRERLPGASLVLYVHNALSRTYGRRELRRLLGSADGVICVSEFMSATVRTRVPSMGERVLTVENGVDLDHFTPDGSPKSSRPLFVVFAGQVAPHKGPHLLLQAMAEVQRASGPPMKASIVGSSSYDAGNDLSEYELGLRRTVDSEGLHVEFVPFVDRDRLRELYRSASLVCIPSVFDDPFPLVAFEAMACGTGLVTSDRGGLPAAGGDAAVTVDPTDAAAFARVLVELAEHPDEVQRLAGVAAARVQGRTWPRVNDRIMEIVAGWR